MENLKKQNTTFMIDLKARDDRLAFAEKQIEETKLKLKLSKDEIENLEEQLKTKSNDLSNVSNAKEDLEHKVKLSIFNFYNRIKHDFILSFSNAIHIKRLVIEHLKLNF